MLERKEPSVTIFRGDDTGGQLGKTIIINFHCGDTVNMEGVVVTFILGGFYEKEFRDVHDGDRLKIFMTHEQTAMLPLGVSFGKLYGTDASGKIRTFSNRIPIRVTNHVCEAYGSAEESGIDVTISNAITWDSIFGKPDTFPPSEHRHQKSDIDFLENDLQTLSDGVESAIEAAEAAKTEAEKGVRTVNSKAPTNGNVKIVLDDLADKDGNIETTKNIMVSRDGGETHVAVALYSDLISEINTHNNNEAAHPELMSTVARVFATKTEVEAKADKSALQAEVNRAQTAETQLTTKAENAQSAANMAQSSADAAQNAANVASDKADALYAELANKLDKTIPAANGNLASLTADGNLADSGKNASDFLPASSRYVGTWDVYDMTTFRGDFSVGPSGELLGITSSHGSLYKFGDNRWYYGESQDPASEIAVKGDISELESSKADRASLAPEYSATSAYSIGAIVYHDGNIYQCKTAIAAGGEAWNAAHWELRKLDDFFTESNSLLNGRLAYSRNATGLKDRAFNTLSFDGTEYNLSTALAAVTPTASGQPRDLLIVATATAATTISFTAGTIKGDKPTIDGAGTWLITLTEYAANTWYCRQIKMEDAA